MRLGNRLGIQICLLALVGLQLACAKKVKSDDALISINPTRPVVITANITFSLHGADTTITGPWFKFSVGFNNKSDEIITVVSMHTEVTGIDASGNIVTQKADYDPSTSSYSTDTLTCTYRSFGEFPPNNQASGTPTYDDSLYLSNAGTGCATGTLAFFAQSNPNPGDGVSFHYTGLLKLVGWFGTYDDPSDRFERTLHFSTQ